MVRFGFNYLHNENLNIFGKIGFYFYGLPNVSAIIKFRQFRKFLSQITFKNALDVGCGGGEYIFYLAKKYPDRFIEGADVNKREIEKCDLLKNKLKLNNINFFVKDSNLLNEIEKYDLVYSIHVLDYIKNNKLSLKNLYNSLKKGGKLYLNLPTPDWHEYSLLKSALFKNYLEKSNLDHVGDKHNLQELIKIINSIGFKIIKDYYHFGLIPRLLWEIDIILSQRNYDKLRVLLLPFLKLISLIDIFYKPNRGLGMVIIAEK